MNKKLRRELETAKRALDASLSVLSKDCLGIAREIPAGEVLPYDYDLRNPSWEGLCFETAGHVRISGVSELGHAYTAQAILTRLLSENPE